MKKLVMRVMRKLMAASAPAFLCGAAAANQPYQFLTEIPIGGEGGWDILTVDSAASRLYLSHATKVVVVDLNKNAVVGEIADTPGVHGFVAVPELQRGFSSNGKESKSSVVDLKTLKTFSKIDTGESPDAVVYEPLRGERSEEHTSELQSRFDLVCRLLLEKKKNKIQTISRPRHKGDRRRAPKTSISQKSPAITGLVEMVIIRVL